MNHRGGPVYMQHLCDGFFAVMRVGHSNGVGGYAKH